MNHTEALLELIKSKKEIANPEDIVIGISIADIADIWYRKNIWQEPDIITGFINLDNNFLEDIRLTFKKLEKDDLLKITDVRGGVMDFVKEKYPNEIDKNMVLNLKHITSLEDKIFIETTKKFSKYTKKDTELEKYSNTNEDIFLKSLGIKIKDNYILRGKEKIEINPTDKALIYYLYYKSVKNTDECCSLNDLSKIEGKENNEGYIRNRITFINQSIKNIISKEVRVKIPRFIVKGKNKRGYHLNPKILHIK